MRHDTAKVVGVDVCINGKDSMPISGRRERCCDYLLPFLLFLLLRESLTHGWIVPKTGRIRHLMAWIYRLDSHYKAARFFAHCRYGANLVNCMYQPRMRVLK
jgi:hypothetical protein